MFTGIVQEVGRVVSWRVGRAGASGTLAVSAPKLASDIAVGDSVATNGICLTATSVTPTGFTADVSATTFTTSTLQTWLPGELVNLELALTLSTRLGGHLVYGHIDGMATVSGMREAEGRHVTVTLPAELARYAIVKGSITLDGVSLTISALAGNEVTVTVVPYTLSTTTLSKVRVGDRLNLEVDPIGKYVERLLTAGPAASRGGLTVDTLLAQGYS